jgi:fructan beta-fructosidase
MDRSASGIADFSPSFSKLQVAPILGTDQVVSLKIYLDQSSIEIFVDDGTTVFTDLIFPASPYDTVSLQTDKEIDLNSATVYELRSIWERTNERDP